MDTVEQRLDYFEMHPNVKIRYKKSNMIHNIHSDAPFCGAPKAKSLAARQFFLGWLSQDKQPMKLNPSIHILISTTIC